MKHLISLLCGVSCVVMSARAHAGVAPHIAQDGRLVISEEYDSLVIGGLPHCQSVVVPMLQEYKVSFPGSDGVHALTLGMFTGRGNSPLEKTYSVSGFDMGYDIALFHNQAVIELGVRYISLVSPDYVLGYDTAIGFGPYAQAILPATLMDCGGPGCASHIPMYGFIGGGALLSNWDGTYSLYGARDTGFYPFLQFGMGIEMR